MFCFIILFYLLYTTHTHTYIHIYIYIHTHTYIHTHNTALSEHVAALVKIMNSPQAQLEFQIEEAHATHHMTSVLKEIAYVCVVVLFLHIHTHGDHISNTHTHTHTHTHTCISKHTHQIPNTKTHKLIHSFHTILTHKPNHITPSYRTSNTKTQSF